jgi:hypothetical protein
LADPPRRVRRDGHAARWSRELDDALRRQPGRPPRGTAELVLRRRWTSVEVPDEGQDRVHTYWCLSVYANPLIRAPNTFHRTHENERHLRGATF